MAEKLPIPQAMAWKYGAKCSKNAAGDDIETWEHPTLSKPNRIQIIKDLDEYEAHLSAVAYKKKREKEFWPTGDQLDAIAKTFKFLKAAGTNVGPDGDAWVAHVDAVKAKYPKP